MNAYPQNDKNQRGTWKRWDAGPQGQTAAFTCPKCGGIAMLIDHEIGPDGAVSPSVVCPNEKCDFHEYIKLEGWQPE